jgi:type IV fimbrial biogenesis protein FimT
MRGFSLIELLLGVAILGLMLGLGIPRMSEWVTKNRATAAPEFYAEGLRLARTAAVTRNAVSRIHLSANSSNGQYDWQVDICFPTAVLACTDTSGSWSTTGATATGDPDGTTNGFRSVLRPAVGLPNVTVMSNQLLPSGAEDIYFTPLGWVNTAIPDRVTDIVLRPATGYETVFNPAALTIGLAGIAVKCDPDAAAHDSRRCRP